MAAVSTRTCPSCHTRTLITAVHCPVCGARFIESSVATPTALAASSGSAGVGLSAPVTGPVPLRAGALGAQEPPWPAWPSNPDLRDLARYLWRVFLWSAAGPGKLPSGLFVVLLIGWNLLCVFTDELLTLPLYFSGPLALLAVLAVGAALYWSKRRAPVLYGFFKVLFACLLGFWAVVEVTREGGKPKALALWISLVLAIDLLVDGCEEWLG
jgi:hypothetical protein